MACIAHGGMNVHLSQVLQIGTCSQTVACIANGVVNVHLSRVLQMGRIINDGLYSKGFWKIVMSWLLENYLMF